MPELPEVETMRRGIAAIAGHRIKAVHKLPCRLKPIRIQPRIDAMRRRVQGKRVAMADRLGKRLVVRLEDGSGLVFEPRMTGLVTPTLHQQSCYLRFHMEMADGPVRDVWFWDRRGLGSVYWLSSADLRARLEEGALGPDALALTVEGLLQQLSGSRREIKVALLDQRALAGVGNLYASEILHLAGIHPQTRCCALTPSQWRDVHAALHQVLEEAVRYEGSTLGDGTYVNSLNKAAGYQNHHRVYDRAGQLCGRCGNTIIERMVQAQRSTFFCRTCQS